MAAGRGIRIYGFGTSLSRRFSNLASLPYSTLCVETAHDLFLQREPTESTELTSSEQTRVGKEYFRPNLAESPMKSRPKRLKDIAKWPS